MALSKVNRSGTRPLGSVRVRAVYGSRRVGGQGTCPRRSSSCTLDAPRVLPGRRLRVQFVLGLAPSALLRHKSVTPASLPVSSSWKDQSCLPMGLPAQEVLRLRHPRSPSPRPHSTEPLSQSPCALYY